MSNDTGPQHLAVGAAAGPVLGLYHAPKPSFEPGPPHGVVRAPRDGGLAALTVETVYAAAKAMLGVPPGAG